MGLPRTEGALTALDCGADLAAILTACAYVPTEDLRKCNAEFVAVEGKAEDLERWLSERKTWMEKADAVSG